MQEYPNHPAAEIFPLMDHESLQKLAADIAEHGLLEPICIYEEQILDGRNRYQACLMANVEPTFAPCALGDLDPIEYVVSKNLHRRHLTIPQRAALALDLIPQFSEQAAKRQRYLGKPTETEFLSPEEAEDKGEAVEKVADLVGLGKTTLWKAVAIQRRDPRVIDKMRTGEIKTVDAARRAAGMIPGKDSSISPDLPQVYYGKGDRWREATQPILRYLTGWERRGYEFRHLNPAEARRRIKVIEELESKLTDAKSDLEQRAVKATTTVEGR